MLNQEERVPQGYTLITQPGEGSNQKAIHLRSDGNQTKPCDFTFEAIRPNVFRTTFTSEKHPLPPFPSVRLPATDNTGTAATTITQLTEKSAKQITLEDAQAGTTATVDYTHTPVVSINLHGKPLHADLPHRSYALDGAGAAHYSAYKQGTLHVGLGEKAAPMDLSGRGFLITASDTFGYDAHHTDPLYKHVPLLINVIPGVGAVGLVSTSHARGAWAIGSEIDGLWGRFKVYRQARGGLEEYLIVGGSVAEVVRTYAGLVGFPLLVPRYYFGYVSGGMRYSMLDEPVRAADAIVGFLDKCKDLDIPVSAHQMSSGYTVSETPPKTRNVFTWNYHRFPDPRDFTRQVHKRGVRILANIKPYVLANHPDYNKLSEAGAFFRDPQTGKTAVARLWSAGGGESGEGSHVDFTSEAGYKWWYDGCRSLKEVGIDAMWNDNNEYNISNDTWECALNLPEDVEAIRINATPAESDNNQLGLWGRAANTELMGKSSWQACVDAEPEVRPMVLTRSATIGTMKYACASWSGDNVTSWDGMKGSNALALNAGMSLLQCYGHDIGGFEGPQPTPEHLVRWVQMGVHSPRFAINCYKTSPEDNLVGEVIEPWQYPESTDLVRAAVKRRYELLPYVYSLSLKSHLTAVPPQRWTGWGYEADENVWSKAILAGDTQYWLGDALLVAGAFEPGQQHVDVYLPSSDDSAKQQNGDVIRYSSQDTSPTTKFGFFDTKTRNGQGLLPSGGWQRVDATLDLNGDQGLPPNHIPVLARAGSAVPVGKNRHTTSSPSPNPEFPGEEKDDWRGVEMYPPSTDQNDLSDSSARRAAFETTWYEDDGSSAAHIADAQRCTITLEYTVNFDSGDAGIDVKCTIKGTGQRENGGTGLTWQPLWLDNGLDIILPKGLGSKVNGASDVTEARSGSDAYASEGRKIWNIPVAREWST